MKRNSLKIILAALLCAGTLSTMSCSKSGVEIDPGLWGYDCEVVYDALGGIINTKGVRTTYYQSNSYLFYPSGTTNMLVKPVKEGYVLAGWYTDKEDIVDENGNVVGYSFRAEDRWDFEEDRIQEDTTLYARWIKQPTVDYINVDTGETVFNKKITAASPVQVLSSATERLCTPSGMTLLGYYSDESCETLYDFSEYTHKEMLPTNHELYAQLAVEFPDCFEVLTTWEEDTEVVDAEGFDESEAENDENAAVETVENSKDTSYLFIEKAGFRLLTDDETMIAQIRSRKDEIIEQYLNEYSASDASKTVYLKFVEGNYCKVTDIESLKRDNKYYMDGQVLSSTTSGALSKVDGYILYADLDFSGITLNTASEFTGKIFGNGYTIKNVNITVNNKKTVVDTHKYFGFFKKTNGAYFEAVNFDNINIYINSAIGNSTTIGVIAGASENTEMVNCKISNVLIKTGTADKSGKVALTDGRAVTITDILGDDKNCLTDEVTLENIRLDISGDVTVEDNTLLSEVVK